MVPYRKCKICDAEVESTVSFPSRPSAFRVHLRTSHPEFAKWEKRRNRLGFVLLCFGSVLLLLGIFYQGFQYVAYAYLLGMLLLLFWRERRKIRAVRDAWMKTHPPAMRD